MSDEDSLRDLAEILAFGPDGRKMATARLIDRVLKEEGWVLVEKPDEYNSVDWRGKNLRDHLGFWCRRDDNNFRISTEVVKEGIYVSYSKYGYLGPTPHLINVNFEKSPFSSIEHLFRLRIKQIYLDEMRRRYIERGLSLPAHLLGILCCSILSLLKMI